jgi:hypothetical protein
MSFYLNTFVAVEDSVEKSVLVDAKMKAPVLKFVVLLSVAILSVNLIG